jgi:hypothetical protein
VGIDVSLVHLAISLPDADEGRIEQVREDPMTAPTTITNGRGADIDAWKQRLGAGCARFYAHLSVATFALAFFTYDASEPNSSVRYGNL